MSVEIYTENYRLGSITFSVELTADPAGLTACRMLAGSAKPQKLVTLKPLTEAAKFLDAYFSGDHSGSFTRLAPDGTAFQKEVWDATRTIPSGEVRSYTWLAQQLGCPKAVRAVARALGANPLLLFVPCHRVIRSDGQLGGFSAGLDLKVLLLAHEGLPGGVQQEVNYLKA